MFDFAFTTRGKAEKAARQEFSRNVDDLSQSFRLAVLNTDKLSDPTRISRDAARRIGAYATGLKPAESKTQNLVADDAILQRYIKAVELAWIAATTYAGVVALQVGAPVRAAHHFNLAKKRCETLLGRNHELMTSFSATIAKLPDTKTQIELHVPAILLEKPKVTLHDFGFEVVFKLTPSRSFAEFKRQVSAICLAAEKAWEKRYDDDTYNSDCSDLSSLNELADKAPKLFSCDGLFRGRVSKSQFCDESFNSEFEQFGASEEPLCVGYLISNRGTDRGLYDETFRGYWKIVADGK